MSKSGDNMSITRSRNHDCRKHYELKTYKKFFNCDGCKMKGFGERYTCNPCGRELHKECRHPKSEVSHENFAGSVFKFHNKPFTRRNRKNHKEFSKCCDACGKDICGFNYHCEADDKDLHPCCLKLEKKLVIDGDNMSITRSRSHDCRKHYELKTYKKFFNCDGCKMKGFGERYTCNPCGRELHKECRHPKSEVSHENFAGSVFKFHKKPFTRPNKKNGKKFSKVCDACGKDICGFNYHCEADNKDLHPCCRKLEKKLVIDGKIFDLKTKVSSKCGKCGERKISRDAKNVLGWSYVSQCKEYHFHVYCITEIVQETYMKYGDLALENMDLKQLVKNNTNRSGGSTFLTTIKLLKPFVKILLSALLGDPTMLISNVVVDLILPST